MRKLIAPMAAGALALAALLAPATTAPAGAATLTRTGTLSAADPVMDVVSINGNTDACGSQGSFDVHYEVIPFTAPVGGSIELRLTSTPENMASFYVYDGPFDPANGAQNCLAGDNTEDNPGHEKTVTINAQDERTYRLVVFDDTFGQAGGTFRFVIELPGGKAIDPATGAGKRYVGLPGSFSCSDLTADVAWKSRAAQVRSAVFKAGNRVVARVGDPQIGPGRTTRLRDLPGNTNRLSATLTLRGGGHPVVRRLYTRC